MTDPTQRVPLVHLNICRRCGTVKVGERFPYDRQAFFNCRTPAGVKYKYHKWGWKASGHDSSTCTVCAEERVMKEDDV